MTTKKSPQTQMETILKMLKKLIFTVSNVDQAIQDNSVSEYESENGIVVFTTILLDLKKRRHVFYRSAYTHYLKTKTTNINVRDNLFNPYYVVHPNDIEFFFETQIIILNLLQQLPPFKTKSFMAVFTLKLLEKDGKYKTYLCHVCVKKEDANGKSWILKIEAERQPNDNFPTFRKFFAASDDYIETHEQSLFLQNMQLTMQHLEILKLKMHKQSASQIAATQGISVKTVTTHYSNINDKMKLDAIDISARVAKAIGWIN
jgi:DNA-binding CsgD family transcriptional regulator